MDQMQIEDWSDTLKCPSSPFNHQASFVPLISSKCNEQPSQTNTNASQGPSTTTIGIRYLAQVMGYRIRSIADREIHLIQSDALTYIEKMVSGKPTTRRPREMEPQDVRKKLQKTIPAQCFNLFKVSQEQLGIEGWVCDVETLAKVAAKYIMMLKKERGGGLIAKCGTETRGAHRTVCTRELSDGGTKAVEKTLVKIEAWCDSWLDGKLGDTDWDKMEKCL